MTLDCIAVLLEIGRPTFSHSVQQIVSIAVVVVWLLMLRMTSASTEELERLLGLAVLDALGLARLTVKEACVLMAVDYFHFMAAVKCERGRHISLTRLVRLPFSFWMFFLPQLTYMIAKQHVTDIAEQLRRPA